MQYIIYILINNLQYKRKNTETKITANDSTSCDSIMLESDP